MYEWIKGSTFTALVTMTDTNITLNNSATSHFTDVRWVLVGLDYETAKLAIKPVTRSDYDLRIYPLEDLHKISIGNGYARITNKSIMNTIAGVVGKPLENSKYLATWDEQQNMLEIDLTKEYRG
ncbi:MAG: hypothetical protein IJL94_03200 [Erysipelotrichaceae bacterium]|nr:hypothetical protein [Erysipelotrichaceae bacterium]